MKAEIMELRRRRKKGFQSKPCSRGGASLKDVFTGEGGREGYREMPDPHTHTHSHERMDDSLIWNLLRLATISCMYI